MNKPSVERLLLRLQAIVIPVVALLILLGISFKARADEAPSMELLEFLGEWETNDGDWIDPMRFLDMDVTELDSEDLKKVKSNEDSSND